MPFTMTMPKLSPTMEEGVIAKWHKKEGDFIEAGEMLLEVATDKATVEHNVLDEGWLRKILVKDGDEASVNQPIAIFTADKEESIEGYEPEGVAAKKVKEAPQKEEQGAAASAEKPKPVVASAMGQPVFAPEEPLTGYRFQKPTEELQKRVLASPLAKKLAVDKGLDITTIKGSGPRGRIMSHDLDLAQPSSAITFGSRKTPTEAAGSYEEEKLTPMRKVISQRLQEAKTFIPHFYVSQTVDATNLVAAREQLKAVGVKVTYNDFVIRACALALREHPTVNSGFNTQNNTVTHYKTIDISIAVTIEAGLITPIIRYADFKNLGELSVEAKSLAKRAREGKLEPQEYKGGSFTISNLGMFGVTDFMAIINPPQAGILAVGGIQEVPVIREGVVVPGKTMTISLSCDHRVIDGVVGAQFVNSVKHYLENAASLLV